MCVQLGRVTSPGELMWHRPMIQLNFKCCLLRPASSLSLVLFGIVPKPIINGRIFSLPVREGKWGGFFFLVTIGDFKHKSPANSALHTTMHKGTWPSLNKLVVIICFFQTKNPLITNICFAQPRKSVQKPVIEWEHSHPRSTKLQEYSPKTLLEWSQMLQWWAPIQELDRQTVYTKGTFQKSNKYTMMCSAIQGREFMLDERTWGFQCFHHPTRTTAE